jgi:hypothetical protein
MLRHVVDVRPTTMPAGSSRPACGSQPIQSNPSTLDRGEPHDKERLSSEQSGARPSSRGYPSCCRGREGCTDPGPQLSRRAAPYLRLAEAATETYLQPALPTAASVVRLSKAQQRALLRFGRLAYRLPLRVVPAHERGQLSRGTP